LLTTADFFAVLPIFTLPESIGKLNSIVLVFIPRTLVFDSQQEGKKKGTPLHYIANSLQEILTLTVTSDYIAEPAAGSSLWEAKWVYMHSL